MSDNPGAPAQGKRPLRFPDGFLIGASTAGHQTEGNNTNSDWWEFEHRPGSPVHEPSGDACDSYHRYPEDIGLAAGSGLNAYRFSVEWPRLEPAEGMFSRAETAHYRRVLAACHEHGIVPVVTYNHFTLPLWLQRRGGFAADDFPQLFQRFCTHITRTLGDLIGWAVTINEPEGAGDAGYVLGIHPPGIVGDRELAHRVADNVLTAHHLGVKAIHDHGSMPVGVSLALQDMQYEDGATPGKTEWELNALISERYIEAAQEDDFVGLQTYTRIRFGPEGERGPGLHPESKNGLAETDDTTQVGWEFYPEALDGDDPAGSPSQRRQADPAHRERHRHHPRSETGGVHGPGAARRAHVPGRRYRRARLPPLVTSRQLRVVRRIRADLRSRRGRPSDLRSPAEGERVLARRRRTFPMPAG